MSRLSFRCYFIAYAEPNSVALISPADRVQTGGMSSALVDFFVQYGECAHCGRAISNSFTRCLCGKPKDESKHLDIRFPTALYRTGLAPLLQKESSHQKVAKRKQTMETNGGKSSKKDIAALYDVQNGLCFFCGKALSHKGGKQEFHIDHFQPVSRGGSSDIRNLVLTCIACNLEKGNSHGEDFEQTVRKRRHPDMGRILGRIRRARTMWLKARTAA